MKALFSLALAVAGLLAGNISRADACDCCGEDPWARKPSTSIKTPDGLIVPYPDEPGRPKLDPPQWEPNFPKPLPYPRPWDPCPTRPKPSRPPKPWPYPPYPTDPEPWPWLKPGTDESSSVNQQATKPD